MHTTCGLLDGAPSRFLCSSFTKLELSKMPDTPLHTAVKQGNKTLVKDLLKRGESISTVDSDGNTPLHLSFLKNQSEITDVILNHMKETSNYSNPKNNQGISHLHIASTRQDKDLVQALIMSFNAPTSKTSPLLPNKTPLDLAIEHKSPEVAQCLAKAIDLRGFADADRKNILHEENPGLPLFNHKFILLYHLFASKDEAPSCNILPKFHSLCYHGVKELIEAYIRIGVDVNEPMSPEARYGGSYTPLHVAIEAENKEIVQLLLDNGADPNRRTSHYMTALHLALYTNDYRAKDTIVDRLYAVVKDKEADLMDLYGLTYLHVACTRNDVQLVKKLLDQGADVNRKVLKNVRSYTGFTPLHFAVLWRRVEMVKLLIERGAEMDFDDVECPLHLASLVGHEDIIKLLLDRGADPTIPHPESLKTVLHLLAEHVIDTDWAFFYKDDDDKFYTDDIRKMRLADLVETLVKAGVDVDEEDDKGYTALHYACTNIYEGSIFADQLIKWGADINHENDDEQTPLQLVMEDNYKFNGTDYVTLYHCVQRIKDLGLEVNPKNEECCEEIAESCGEWEKNYQDWLQMNGHEPQAVEMPKKAKQRKDEIERMKMVKLTKKVSLYDFVKMETDKAAAHFGNKVLKEVLKETEYEEYGDTIELQYWKASLCAADEKEAQKKKKKPGKPGKGGAKRKRV